MKKAIVAFQFAFFMGLGINSALSQGSLFCEAFIYLSLDDTGSICLEPYDSVTIYSPPLDSFYLVPLTVNSFPGPALDSTWVLSFTTMKGANRGLKFTCDDLGGPIRFFYIDTITDQILCWTDAYVFDHNIPEACSDVASKNITDPFPSSTTHTATSSITASTNTIMGDVTFQAPDSINILPPFTVLNGAIFSIFLE